MPVDFKHATLSNGLTVIAEIDPEAHTAATGFFVKTGARDEASEVMGVSHFLEHMMFKGTEKRTADDINREFDEIGAKYNAYTTSEMTCFYAHVLPEMLPQADDLLADMLRPSLRDDDFNAERGVILEEIAMYKDEPFWVLYERLLEERYQGHPLGHRVLGTTETITALQRDQMRAYFDGRYSADNTVVALAGRVDFDETLRRLNDLCGAWNTSRPERDNSEPDSEDRTLRLTDEKLSRAYLLTLAPAPAMQDERRYAAMLLAKALGDPDNSRLHWALIETGLAEEAQAAYEPHDGGGDYFVFAACPPARADEVQGVIEHEIDAVVQNITDDDLERLRNRIATAVVLASERPSGRMQRIGRQWLYLHAWRSLEDELEAINSVTLNDIRALHEAFPFRPRAVGRLNP